MIKVKRGDVHFTASRKYLLRLEQDGMATFHGDLIALLEVFARAFTDRNRKIVWIDRDNFVLEVPPDNFGAKGRVIVMSAEEQLPAKHAVVYGHVRGRRLDDTVSWAELNDYDASIARIVTDGVRSVA